MHHKIENILFSRFAQQPINFELITIEALYQRLSEKNYDPSIPHRIEFNALLIVSEGESFHTVDFKTVTLSAGRILPLNKGQVHSFNKKRTIKGYIIAFEENFITQNTSDNHLIQFLQIYHTPQIKLAKKSLNALIPILQLIDAFLKEDNATLKSEIVHSTFMTLLFQIKRLACDQHKDFDNQKLMTFYLLKDLMSKNFNKIHSAKAYAKQLNVSYKYLNEICKAMVNKTAKEFIDSWLLLEIKRTLSEKKYTSQEIAFKMGFQEPSNFIRFFKKHTHLTPLQFQEKIKTGSIRD